MGTRNISRATARAHARVQVCARLVLASLVALAVAMGAAPLAHADAVPVGSIVSYGGSTLPTGWRWADGAAVGRTAEAELFAVLGTTYGPGDGSTTFNLPDMRQRFALGKAASGTGSTLGSSGGAIDHVHSATLTGHSHTATLGGHTHGLNAFSGHAHTWQGTGVNAPDGGYYGTHPTTLMSTDASCGGGCAAGNVTSTSSGAGAFTSSTVTQPLSTAAANPPFQATHHIVKAVSTAVAPCGAVWSQARSTPPAGAIAADGAARSRATSSALYGCLGAAFGAGDGSTTFNLPDLRQRLALGKATTGTGSTLGATGGSIDHANAVTGGAHGHTFNVDHTHQATEPSHTHGVPIPATSMRALGSVYGFWGSGYINGTSTAGSSGTVTSSTAGGGAAASATDGIQAASVAAANPPFQSLEPIVYDAGTDGYAVAAGTVVAYGGTIDQPGWMLADGRAISRATYADLFALLGTTYGVGDGSTTFNLPDLRQRIPLGRAASGTGSTLGGTGGSIDHVHGVTVPAHTHAFTPPGHGHSFSFGNHTHQVFRNPMDPSWLLDGCCGSGNVILDYGPITTSANGGQTVGSLSSASGAVSTSSSGGASVTSTSHNPPYLVTNYLIAVDVDVPVATLLSPADAATFTTMPTFSARYDEPSPGTPGSIAFQVCSDSTCATVVASGVSATNLAPGATGSWTPGSLLSGARWWRARATDAAGNVGPWSATRTITVDFLTISLSTLGYDDVARDTAAPHAIGFGSTMPGAATEIGPAGSGQGLAGAAVEVTVSSPSNFQLLASSSNWVDGANTIPASALSWRHASTAEAWTSFATTQATVEPAGVPGTTTWQYDWRVVVPAAQAPGSYTATVSYTTVAIP